MNVLRVAICAAALLLLSGTSAVASQEDDIATCRYRSERVQDKLERVVDKYGSDSGHAAKVRKKFEAVHEWCWRRYHGWWDEDLKTWRTDHW